MEAKGMDPTEISEALERLEQQAAAHPGKDLISEEIEKTAFKIDKEDVMDGYLSGNWKTLGERFEEWENDHPGFTLAIGDIARALSIYGL